MEPISTSTRLSIVQALAKELCSLTCLQSRTQDICQALHQVEASAYELSADVGAYLRACTSGAASIKQQLISAFSLQSELVQKDVASCSSSALSDVCHDSCASFCSIEDHQFSSMDTSETRQHVCTVGRHDHRSAARYTQVQQLTSTCGHDAEGCRAMPLPTTSGYACTTLPYCHSAQSSTSMTQQTFAPPAHQPVVHSRRVERTSSDDSLLGLFQELSDSEPWPFIDEVLGTPY